LINCAIIEPAMNKYTKPNLKSSALLTIDTQNDFTLDDAPVHISGTKEIIPNMAQLLDCYRANKQLIIHVIRLYLGDGSNAELCRRERIESGTKILLPGSPGAELIEVLQPDDYVMLDTDRLLSGNFQQVGENEFIMYKPRWGAFYRTPLEESLCEHKIDTLVFTGCNFPNCPRTSIYEASERDFRLVLVKDAVSRLSAEGETEMGEIGVELLATVQLQEALAKN
jgi:nicotinamidase-related amidase